MAFPAYLATQVGYIIGLSQLESQSATKPIGTGPFKFVAWDPNDHFTVKRNPNYWRKGLPYLDALTYKPIVEDQSRETSLRSGTIDLMVTRDPDVIPDLRDNAELPAGAEPDGRAARHGLHLPQHHRRAHQRPHSCARPWPTPPTSTSS